MLDSEKMAIAAHLHVLLRRVHGRVTDVEWMIKSPDYAREVVRVARAEPHDDLHRLAARLEDALQLKTPALAPRGPGGRPFAAPGARDGHSVPPDERPSDFGAPSDFDPRTGQRRRYVGSLR